MSSSPIAYRRERPRKAAVLERQYTGHTTFFPQGAVGEYARAKDEAISKGRHLLTGRISRKFPMADTKDSRLIETPVKLFGNQSVLKILHRRFN
jgi:hypothetical protein